MSDTPANQIPVPGEGDAESKGVAVEIVATDRATKFTRDSIQRLISIGKALERNDTAFLGQIRDGILKSAEIVHAHRKPKNRAQRRAGEAKARKARK